MRILERRSLGLVSVVDVCDMHTSEPRRASRRKFEFSTALASAVVVFFAPFLGAQSSRGRKPASPRCYRLSHGEWSHPLGVNAAYHAIPAIVRLDTVPDAGDGWTVAPDIAFPTGHHFPGMPRWTQQGDSIGIVWSNGYQVTTVRLGPSRGEDLRGTATVRSDANEFGTDLPRASIVARPAPCTGRP